MDIEKVTKKPFDDFSPEVKQIAVEFVGEIWKFLDAASEKPKPLEYLSKETIHAIQGFSDEEADYP